MGHLGPQQSTSGASNVSGGFYYHGTSGHPLSCQPRDIP